MKVFKNHTLSGRFAPNVFSRNEIKVLEDSSRKILLYSKLRLNFGKQIACLVLFDNRQNTKVYVLFFSSERDYRLSIHVFKQFPVILYNGCSSLPDVHAKQRFY